VEDAKKLKKQKSEEEEKLEKKKRIEKFKKEALQEYLSRFFKIFFNFFE